MILISFFYQNQSQKSQLRLMVALVYIEVDSFSKLAYVSFFILRRV
jgi:hypothetical protein